VFDSGSEHGQDEDDEWVEKDVAIAPLEEDIEDQRDQNLRESKLQRDAWMQDSSALDSDYVQPKKSANTAPKGQFVSAKGDSGFSMTGSTVHASHLDDLKRDLDSSDDEHDVANEQADDVTAERTVTYTFGDNGSSWRMTKLKAVYRQAEESGKSVDEVALERYGDLRDFDDAREEERELDRRKLYGKEYVGLEKPSGEFFQDRLRAEGAESAARENDQKSALQQAQVEPDLQAAQASAPTPSAPLDSTALNKLKAQLMKAKLRKAPNVEQLEAEYTVALEQASAPGLHNSDTVILNAAETRHLAHGRAGEVTALTGKRAQERGTVVENEDMSIEDMVRVEKRSKNSGGEGRNFAERIAKDGRFKDDLDYMDDNAANLSKKVTKSDTQLKSAAVGDYQRMQKVLSSCPLCHHEEAADPSPTAPIVSLGTRTYLTLPTLPEISPKNILGAVIVPIQHHLNLLECDEDEWEELRNFMKSLTRHYDAQDLGVIFYENAAHFTSRRGHAAMQAIPVPRHLAANAPAYFKEAILAEDERWSQHKPLIDTLALSARPGYGKAAFRKAMVKELPYFHVWYSLDGGLGHVVEDERRWPKGDGFAREVLGGMLGLGVEVVKKQGRWDGGDRKSVDGFRKKWRRWDWTRALVES